MPTQGWKLPYHQHSRLQRGENEYKQTLMATLESGYNPTATHKSD